MEYSTGHYPLSRLRRMRNTPACRALFAEHNLSPQDMIWPLFLKPGIGEAEPISSLPGVYRLTSDKIVEIVKPYIDQGLTSIAIFPCPPPTMKSDDGAEALNPCGFLPDALYNLRKHFPHLMIIADIALDPYTSHGHDGILMNGETDNDLTIRQLCQQSIVLAQAGADSLAPSDMMDGRIQAIRTHLNSHELDSIRLFSYAVKYASSLYSPFRQAVHAPTGTCKKSYQMDPRNAHESMREAIQDIQEGADALIIKPAGFYGDIIHNISSQLHFPVLAYQVSGEYAMIHYAASQIDKGDQLILESLISLKRAGASGMFTYFAPRVLSILNHKNN